MTNHKPLTQDEEQALFKKYNETLDACAQFEIIHSNLGLVKSIAHNYMIDGVEYEDLVSEGTIGLIKAIVRFDYSKGYRFSTYAHWWIRQAILRYITNHSRTVRIPSTAYQRFAKIRRYISDYELKYGFSPTASEIADSIGIRESEVNLYLSASNKAISLQILIGDDEESELINYIADDEATLEEACEKRELDEAIRRAVSTFLTPRERVIIKNRFGLGNSDKMTLLELGKRLGLTQAAVRRNEATAIRKLRHGLNKWGYGKAYVA